VGRRHRGQQRCNHRSRDHSQLQHHANQRLAIKRAQAVRDALINRGVAADLIATDAKGEMDLLVDTPDNVREPANRRVNISFN
ncbi:MAG: OmpA family protein, partial [Pseudomonadota bacterium]